MGLVATCAAFVSPERIYESPQKPLDGRISPEKITENELPPLPQRVALPMPPLFRLSEQPSQVPVNSELWRKANEAMQKGLSYLRSAQHANGGWMVGEKAAPTDQPDRSAPVTIAVTALALKAFVQAEPEVLKHDARIAKALKLVLDAHNADGSFDKSNISNYVTASVLSALASIEDKDFPGALLVKHYSTEAAQWLQVSQWDQSEGLSPRQDWFGGAGYGNSGRPDMSNTQMMLDALYDAGLSPDEPAFQKALAFASRTQNLKSTNSAAWAGNDGGFIYTPANGGESMASEAAGEGRYGEKLVAAGQPRSLRSYGSMTYAGFKSMLYAGLSQDDVRVRAAFDWVRRNWTFDENPGMGQQGLYYYYHTLARALRIAQQHEITDIQGVKHNWREELIHALLKRQSDDGSWKNAADRWLEGSPELVTVYAVLAIQEILKPVN
jgi:squalene-hopene/tetraprenyl-beta-curcumene cyclase